MEANPKLALVIGWLSRLKGLTGTQLTVVLVATIGFVVVALALVKANYTVRFRTNETDIHFVPAITPADPRGSNAGPMEQPTGHPGP